MKRETAVEVVKVVGPFLTALLAFFVLATYLGGGLVGYVFSGVAVFLVALVAVWLLRSRGGRPTLVPLSLR